MLNDIGPDAEQGSQRITQMVGGRPDTFATLDDAMAWRRDASPIVAGRDVADQRELALGLLRQRADGTWGWKMDPAYVRQRVEHGAPVRPELWPTLAGLACPTLVVWGTDSDVLSEAQARRMVDTLPKGELLAIPGVGHAPCLVEPASLAGLERFLTGRAHVRGRLTAAAPIAFEECSCYVLFRLIASGLPNFCQRSDQRETKITLHDRRRSRAADPISRSAAMVDLAGV